MNDTPIATQACSHITFIAYLIFGAIAMHLIQYIIVAEEARKAEDAVKDKGIKRRE